jgi:hypothetical protein
MTRTWNEYLCIFVCMTTLIWLTTESAAQETSASSVHWAYSSYFGSGWYQVTGDRDVFVIRGTPRWELREADLSVEGERTVGIELRFPVTVGLDNFSVDDIPGTITPSNLASVSVTPGIDITVPITERWLLRPHMAIGWGSALDGSDSAWTYWAGLKSRYSFQNGDLNWALINAITYVGNTPTKGSSDDFWPLMAGLEFDYPLGKRQMDNEQLYLSWHGTYTSFEGDLDQTVGDGSVDPITDQWQFGLSIRKKKEPIKIWFMKFDRLGLAYRFSSSGDLKGISFVFRSVFDS